MTGGQHVWEELGSSLEGCHLESSHGRGQHEENNELSLGCAWAFRPTFMTVPGCSTLHSCAVPGHSALHSCAVPGHSTLHLGV